MKATGKEWKDYQEDTKAWPEGAWMDDEVIRVNGKKVEDLDPASLEDTDIVELTAGVYFPGPDTTPRQSLISHFRQWLTRQNGRHHVIFIPTGMEDAVRKSLTKFGVTLL